MHNWANFCDIVKIDKNNRNLVAVIAARFFLNDDSLTSLKNHKVHVVPPEIDMIRELTIKEAKIVDQNKGQIKISFNEDVLLEASAFVGKSLLIDEEICKKVFGEDGNLDAKLIGLEVKDDKRGNIGKIVDVAGTSAQKHLVVKNEKGEVLIPFVDEIVKSQNDKEIIVELPEGLLELNEA